MGHFPPLTGAGRKAVAPTRHSCQAGLASISHGRLEMNRTSQLKTASPTPHHRAQTSAARLGGAGPYSWGDTELSRRLVQPSAQHGRGRGRSRDGNDGGRIGHHAACGGRDPLAGRGASPPASGSAWLADALHQLLGSSGARGAPKPRLRSSTTPSRSRAGPGTPGTRRRSEARPRWGGRLARATGGSDPPSTDAFEQ